MLSVTTSKPKGMNQSSIFIRVTIVYLGYHTIENKEMSYVII